MAKELINDADLRFSCFNSFPNSAAFEPSTMLEFAKNVELNEGVIEMRKGSLLVYDAGAPIAYSCCAHGPDGDSILIDLEKRVCDLEVSEAELQARRARWHAPAPLFDTGWLQLYRRNVDSLSRGAVLTRDAKP